MIDPEHKAKVDAVVTRLFKQGIIVRIPQTEEAYASVTINAFGLLTITAKVLSEKVVEIYPEDN